MLTIERAYVDDFLRTTGQSTLSATEQRELGVPNESASERAHRGVRGATIMNQQERAAFIRANMAGYDDERGRAVVICSQAAWINDGFRTCGEEPLSEPEQRAFNVSTIRPDHP